MPPFDIAAPGSRRRLQEISAEQPNFVPHEISFPAHMLSLQGAWIDYHAAYYGGPLVIRPEHAVVGGTSGSRLIGTSGAAIGVISTSNVAAHLTNDLPGRLLRVLTCT